MHTSIAAYAFVPVDDPPLLAARLRRWATDAGLLGSVLVAPEGLNLFLAGPAEAIDGFVARLRGDPRFAAIAVKRSHSTTAPFARLKVKVKREIIAFRQPGASPLDGRAPALSPHDLARWIAAGHDDDGRPLRILDTRNREELAHGGFSGAVTLPIDNFTDLPAALDAVRDRLRGHAVVSVCTGGIRCEKAAPWLATNGVEHVSQLDGGILGYFEAVGGAGWDGRCFVFDARIALDPSLRALADALPGDAPGATRIAAGAMEDAA